MNPVTDKTPFLERTQKFFADLDNPQNHFQVIHVAGTAGKGSTTTLLAQMLYADSRSVAALTSPFVTTTLENIWINGQLCDPDLFIRVAHDILDRVDAMPDAEAPSYSETLFAIGVVCAQQAGCEYLVAETGCGGRFDYTNIFSPKKICVLTPIDFDHTDILGDTLEQIAWHKAGIIQKHTLVWSAPQPAQVREIFNTEATAKETKITYIDHAATLDFTPTLAGKHQLLNASLAAEVAQALGVSEHAIRIGSRQARLPARCETMQHDPLVIIDGAHSAIKMQALAEYLKTLSYERLLVIYSAKYSKDPVENILPLLPLCSLLWCTEFHLPGFSSHLSSEMKQKIGALHTNHATKIYEEPAPLHALGQALSIARPNDCVLVTGSLYMAGIARTYFISEERIITSGRLFF